MKRLLIILLLLLAMASLGRVLPANTANGYRLPWLTVQADAALRRDDADNALIIGQAMEPLAEGSGLIWVLVSPR